ncbi:MAG: hypothetical protein QW279_05380, partial [Candidatus Jordarchaeaceae archaeon]
DCLTRRIIREIMIEKSDKILARRLSSMRKKFVKEALERNLSPAQAESEFLERIKKERVVDNENI